MVELAADPSRVGIMACASSARQFRGLFQGTSLRRQGLATFPEHLERLDAQFQINRRLNGGRRVILHRGVPSSTSSQALPRARLKAKKEPEQDRQTACRRGIAAALASAVSLT